MPLVDLTTSKAASPAKLLEAAKCFQCAKCSSGCLSAELFELFPHEVAALARAGFAEELVSSEVIWYCTRCLKCAERCPQRISPSDVILRLRAKAVAEGVAAPDGLLKVLESVIETGLIQGPQPVFTKSGDIVTREDIDLPPLRKPVDIEKFKEAVLSAAGG